MKGKKMDRVLNEARKQALKKANLNHIFGDKYKVGIKGDKIILKAKGTERQKGKRMNKRDAEKFNIGKMPKVKLPAKIFCIHCQTSHAFDPEYKSCWKRKGSNDH